jgi:hypothetical protein
MYGRVDKYVANRVIKIGLQLWGAYENLDLLFPSYIINPTIGASVFGTTDVPWTILARNGDQIVYKNAQITKMGDLFLGVDSELWAANVEITALIANNTAPETANAYYTLSTGQAYADGAFAKTNLLRNRWTSIWTGLAGFSSAFPSQKGIHISWDFDAKPLNCDGYGTVDMTVGENGLLGKCKLIPVGGPTLAQIEAQAAAQGVAIGALLSGISADLTHTSGSHSIALKNAAITEHGYMFGVEPLRIGEIGWETTRGFAAGVPAAIATIA